MVIAGSHKPRGYISGGTRWSWCVYQIQFMFNCVNYCVKKPTKAKKVKLWCFASPFNVFSVYRPPLHSTQRTRRTICPSRTWTNWSWRCSKSRRSEKRCTRYKRSLTGRGKTLRVHTHRVNACFPLAVHEWLHALDTVSSQSAVITAKRLQRQKYSLHQQSSCFSRLNHNLFLLSASFSSESVQLF